MKNKKFNLYYLFACLGVLIFSCYPLYMGVSVIGDMIADGTVFKENYPKYIIPYTPISIAVLSGVLLMPLFFRLFKRMAFSVGTVISTAVFFIMEILFEQKVVVTTAETVSTLEDWQMFMCYIPPEKTITTYKTQTAVDILMGDYNPAFKLHFYVISVVLIITVLNCIYGFGTVIRNGEKKRVKAFQGHISKGRYKGLNDGFCSLVRGWRLIDPGVFCQVFLAVLLKGHGMAFCVVSG